jgi:transcriptional regulator of acetoin/glycerol metabolism
MQPTLRGDAIGLARRRLLDEGSVPGELVGDALAASWQRSMAAGLDPSSAIAEFPRASTVQLAEARERQRELIDHAMPTLAYLHSQTRDTGSVIVLSNAQGLLLQSCGDPEFIDRAARVNLAPGASWTEEHRGTNAVGTSLAMREPTVITGGEHFLACNGFLTCAAAPISDSLGGLLGVLDISGDHRSCHPHTFGLVRAAAQMIENRLFLSRHGGDIRLRFHPLSEGIGTLAEGVVAVSHDGWVVGANPAALALLSLAPSDLCRVSIERLLATRLQALIDWSQRRADEPLYLPQRDHRGLFVRVEMPRAPVSIAKSSGLAPAPARRAVQDALAAFDTGDDRMAAAINRVRRVLAKDIPVLIQGESGVGKELFSSAMHRSGPRRDGPFVAVNCAALPENLIEAELFGYVGGAYTGARREGSVGKIREANGGTLFLDEIGDMPLSLQGRLLRVLQERVVQPLGGGKAVPVDFSLVCATHRQLREAVDARLFRADLYYRINGLTVVLPALRERRDFNRLVASLLDGFEPGRNVVLAPSVAKAFSTHHWPGNLRQLSNVLRTACAMLDERESRIEWEHLPDDLVEDIQQRTSGVALQPQAENLQTQAEQTILKTIEAARGNMAEAARRLGISRNTLYRKLQRIGR